jgi:hypothetical protein
MWGSIQSGPLKENAEYHSSSISAPSFDLKKLSLALSPTTSHFRNFLLFVRWKIFLKKIIFANVL